MLDDSRLTDDANNVLRLSRPGSLELLQPLADSHIRVGKSCLCDLGDSVALFGPFHQRRWHTPFDLQGFTGGFASLGHEDDQSWSKTPPTERLQDCKVGCRVSQASSWENWRRGEIVFHHDQD
jgi:hypothetical protein